MLNPGSIVRVAALQCKAEPKCYQRNRERVDTLLAALTPHRPDIIVMPEMFLHGHWYEADRLHAPYVEPLEGPTLAWMRDHSKRMGALLLGGISEQIADNDRFFSTLLLVDGDELVACYRKRHPASAELLFMLPGSEPAVVETRFGRLALLTCFDMSFPDCILAAAEQRADLLLVANAWLEMERMPFLSGQRFEHHCVLPRAIAMQLRAPAVVANLVGPIRMLVPGLPAFGGGAFEFDTEFAGGSLICDHMGVVVAERPREQGEGFLVAEVNLDSARAVREITLDGAGLDSMRRRIFGQ